MYLLDKLKPFWQKEHLSLKEHFSLEEQNGLGWNLAYVCVGPVLKWGSNSEPPGWKVSTNPLKHRSYTMYLTVQQPDLSE